jgi:hypothetical protein
MDASLYREIVTGRVISVATGTWGDRLMHPHRLGARAAPVDVTATPADRGDGAGCARPGAAARGLGLMASRVLNARRAALLCGTVLAGAVVLTALASSAWADGGAGGNSEIGAAGGAGGTGFTGNAGSNGGSSPVPPAAAGPAAPRAALTDRTAAVPLTATAAAAAAASTPTALAHPRSPIRPRSPAATAAMAAPPTTAAAAVAVAPAATAPW